MPYLANRFTIIVIAALMFQMIGLPVNTIAASEEEIESLIEQLEDKSGDTRIYAATRLGHFGPAAKAAVPALATALNDEYAPVRQAAAQTLKKIGTPEALKAVQQYEAGEPIEIPGIPSVVPTEQSTYLLSAGRNLQTSAGLRYVGLGLGLASLAVSLGDTNSDSTLGFTLATLPGQAFVGLVAPYFVGKAGEQLPISKLKF